ncbi:PAS domain-containing protein [Verrucomicrobia bacterium S94]|nr:PAS domain-containing protein [Verrucomicrobia bacterium S94]
MTQFSIHEAKTIIKKLCCFNEENRFPTRESFMDMLAMNPHVAVQGYNSFGKIFYWNNASVTLYGHRLEEAINKDLVELIIPPEMRKYVRDTIKLGAKNGIMPEPCICDLLQANGQYVTVYSGHLAFLWENSSTPEFYCLDLPVATDT